MSFFLGKGVQENEVLKEEKPVGKRDWQYHLHWKYVGYSRVIFTKET